MPPTWQRSLAGGALLAVLLAALATWLRRRLPAAPDGSWQPLGD